MQLYQDLITLDGWTFIAQICNLMIQLFIFRKFLLKPVRKIIAERKELADSQISDAKRLKDEAQSMKSEYEQSIKDAYAKAGSIVADATKIAGAKSEEMLNEARAQAAAIKQKAEEDIALQKRKALEDARDEIGGMAIEIASKVVEREINEEDHRNLIDEFIQNVGEAL